LFCSPLGSRPGSATPTWLPFVPLTRPPEPPVPIRLYALAEETVPAMSSAVAPLAVPLVLSAIRVLSRAVTPPTHSPPPVGA